MIADRVAAYAAALHDAGAGTWAKIADVLDAAGMGRHRFDELAKAADAWRRAHVAPAARAMLRRRRKEQPPR